MEHLDRLMDLWHLFSVDRWKIYSNGEILFKIHARSVWL